MIDLNPVHLFRHPISPPTAGERLACVLVGSSIGALDAFRAAYPQHSEAFEVAEKVLIGIRGSNATTWPSERVSIRRSISDSSRRSRARRTR